MDAFLNKKYKLSTSEKFDEYMKALGKISHTYLHRYDYCYYYYILFGCYWFYTDYTKRLSHTSYWCFTGVLNRFLINYYLNITVITGTLFVRVKIVWLPVKILWRHDRCVRIMLYSVSSHLNSLVLRGSEI